ncbi:mediator of RNA polymerase II transcription subunit 33A-like isoform X2 [Andrographis paniculata]|uniref:mediator of RNA polymerase II transcription subunit 33A-like isoform X2 n=1 Tax=Andrographis paniculata TaxID=175694 RepID=UPI0021E848D1|nr:mediator of RNA polymerase II transcription subunit 33A-like isoform X2 [Andrographis paniculata]
MEVEKKNKNKNIWGSVLGKIKVGEKEGSDPFLWAIQVSSNLTSLGISLPCLELGHHLVSHICWDNINDPISWKFLEKAMALKIVPPLLVLALLSTKTMDALDQVLQLSQKFNIECNEAGAKLVMYVFSIIWQLLDAILDDEGLSGDGVDPKWPVKFEEDDNVFDETRKQYGEKMQAANTSIAVDLLSQFLQDKVAAGILYLARKTMSKQWESFIDRLRILVEKSPSLRNSKSTSPEALAELISKRRKIDLQSKFDRVSQSGPLVSSAALCVGTSRSTLWLPLDMLLEDAMDGAQVSATSAVEIITGLVKSLQAINATSWHEVFLGLWMSSLRLVQRERDPIEGPVPRLDTRMSMLMSITTLVIGDLIEEEESNGANEFDSENDRSLRKRRKDLIFSLQNLRDYQTLLAPPRSVVPAANRAATKAMMFVSGFNVGGGQFECITATDMPITCSGSLYHLIVEACIARNLLDTSAYFWPGYVDGRINQLPHNVPSQVPGWSSFMNGAALTPTLIDALVSTPASCFAEIEKVFKIAVEGPEEERIPPATILCGASLLHGWNIQEHTLYFITRLLSPPIPANDLSNESYLISYAPMLNVLLVGISPVDCVQIFSLHGLVPELASSLMTLCEVFGSCVPNISWTMTTGEEISVHAVFSNAFALLLKLWRFNHPPIEYGVGDVPPVGSQLTPEYLLLVRNSHLVSSGISLKDPNRRRLAQVASSMSSKPIFVDSFPKLKVWYRQHLACIASPLTGLVNGSPVHHTVDTLLNMMFRKINRVSQSVITVTSGSSSSSGAVSDDGYLRPKLPAWDILEAVPFVADAALTACAHGRLSPRELCTGLKDLADYLPATLATIVSYFSAEVTRGVWKSVYMNGTDWPSPAANLSNVEEQIKKILATTGVDVPSLAAGGSSPASLPLPLAAFVSLTITYKLDNASQRFLDLAGPALESLAAGCPWPCMPIVASLWTQKAKRWSDFLVFSASRTVFLHSNDAVVQLLRTCFSAALGTNVACISSNGGVGALLGHGFGSHFNGGISPVAPGILYLRVYRSIRDIMFLREEIISLLMQTVEEVAQGALSSERPKFESRLSKSGMKHRHASLAAALTKVKLAASFGASVIVLTGGLGLVQSLIKEMLPSWFMSIHRSKRDGDRGGTLPMLRGHALAYLAAFCGAFIWGVDASSSSTAASKRRPKILGYHMEFLASALDGKISLGCDPTTWHAYVSGFLSLMVRFTPTWVLELNIDLLRRLSGGLRRWNEDELALALLAGGGVAAMGSAAQLVVETQLL